MAPLQASNARHIPRKGFRPFSLGGLLFLLGSLAFLLLAQASSGAPCFRQLIALSHFSNLPPPPLSFALAPPIDIPPTSLSWPLPPPQPSVAPLRPHTGAYRCTDRATRSEMCSLIATTERGAASVRFGSGRRDWRSWTRARVREETRFISTIADDEEATDSPAGITFRRERGPKIASPL